jgi:hypothetical protein
MSAPTPRTANIPTPERRISNLNLIAADPTVNNFARSICAEAAEYLSKSARPEGEERKIAGRQRQADADFLYQQAKLRDEYGSCTDVVQVLADLVSKNTLVTDRQAMNPSPKEPT